MLSCSGEESITKDKTPPLKPKMIKHLGDIPDTIHVNNQVIYLTDENNGIDAVSDGNWIMLRWGHLLDSDLEIAKIYRFDEFDPIPVLVNSVSPVVDSLVDSSPDISTYKRYSYYMEVFDRAGNKTLSDTVSYKLISKQILDEPLPEATLDPNNITFKWLRSGEVDKFRLLVLDENEKYLWHFDYDVSFEDIPYEVNLPIGLLQNYSGDFIWWRVDAFKWDFDLNMFVGSESYLHKIFLTSKKTK